MALCLRRQKRRHKLDMPSFICLIYMCLFIFLSEDMRKELDNIYEAIAALPVKVPQARKLPRPIGYKISESKK
jgi:hypothetical protein